MTVPSYRAHPWRVIAQVAAAFAVAMGIGRFVYTPILPLMLDQAGLSAQGGALLATMNYAGYLIGAAAGIVVPRLLQSQLVMRASLLTLVGSLALMPVTHSMPVWSALRLIAGIASALVFMSGVAALLFHLGPVRAHLAGWGMAGVGAGIALSGAAVLALRWTSTWVVAWLVSAGMAAVLAAVAWSLLPDRSQAAAPAAGAPRVRNRPWFAALLASYTLEGVGYIIAGTFLVAAIDQAAPDWVGSSAWILVGIASAVSTVGWVLMSLRVRRINLLAAALLAQAIGVALPALSTSTSAALIAAVLYGGTFVGIAFLSLAIGGELQFPRAVAILTTGYSLGQIVGPLVVAPLLHDGYQRAMLVGAVIVFLSFLAALALRVRYPQPPIAVRR